MNCPVLFSSLKIKVMFYLRPYVVNEVLLQEWLHELTLALEQKFIIRSDKSVKVKKDWGKNDRLTFASSMALEGIKIRGKAYMAPWSGLQWIPGTLLNMSSVSLAFLARLFKTDSFSCLKGRCSVWHVWSGNTNARVHYSTKKPLPN